MTSGASLDSKSGLFLAACNLSGSQVPRLLARSEFWFLLGLHLSIWAACQRDWVSINVDSQDLIMMTVITSFLLTFSTNHCLARYEQACMTVKRMFSAVHDFACQSRLFMGKDRPYDRLACRWMALASVLSVIELQGSEVSSKQWVQLRSLGLARQEDVELLRRLNSQQRFLTIFHIIGEIAQDGLRASSMDRDVVMKSVVRHVLQFKDCHQDLQDMLQVTMPFRYQHLLTVMVFMNLLFLAYGMALSYSVLAPCIFILVELTLMGMLDPCEQPGQGAGL